MNTPLPNAISSEREKGIPNTIEQGRTFRTSYFHSLISLVVLSFGGILLCLAMVSGLGIVLSIFGVRREKLQEHPSLLIIVGVLLLVGTAVLVAGGSSYRMSRLHKEIESTEKELESELPPTGEKWIVRDMERLGNQQGDSSDERVI